MNQPDSAIESAKLELAQIANITNASIWQDFYPKLSISQCRAILERLQKHPAVEDIEKLREKFYKEWCLKLQTGLQWVDASAEKVFEFFLANAPQLTKGKNGKLNSDN